MKQKGKKAGPTKTSPKAPPAGSPPASLSSGRRWAFRLGALLFLPLLLALFELGLRLAGYGYSPHFFKPMKIEGEDFLVENLDFSRRFFPREISRYPNALRMRAHKAPGTIRIFIFGESAAMGDPEPAFGPARYMEMMLRERFPGTNFEVINVAFTAINSHVILPIARECAHYEGDYWIVYMGNNEIVGPYGAGTVFGTQAPLVWSARLATDLQALRTGQLFAELARQLARKQPKSAAWGGMQMFLENQVAPDDPRRETVRQNFQANLTDILRAGLRSHAHVVLNTVAVNLKDSPPFASSVNTNAPAQALADYQAAITQAANFLNASNFASASDQFSHAAALQPLSADAQYGLGRARLAASSYSQALAPLQAACDDDALSFRADTRINSTIRAVTAQFPGKEVHLLDAASALAADEPEKMCGFETFYEHVHFTYDGAYRLGRLWAQQIAETLTVQTAPNQPWPSEHDCDLLLGLSDWNRALVIEHMIGRLQVPPFAGQACNPSRLERLTAEVKRLRSGLDDQAATAARDNFQRQLARAPDDYELHENYALFLQACGHSRDSVPELRRVHELIPQDSVALFQLGRQLATVGELTEAESDLREALVIRPELGEARVELGSVLAVQSKFEDALACFSEALRQRPRDSKILVRMAKINSAMGRHAEAQMYYRQAIDANSSDWEPHYELAGELDSAGQLEEAQVQFADAVKLNPSYSRTHFNHGILLAKLGRLDEAQLELEETLRLEPGYKNALDSLQKIQALKQRAR